MTLEEFYGKIEGNFEEVDNRLPSRSFIRRFVISFLEDPSYDAFMDAYKNNADQKDIFRNIHTLKGVCMNLGFSAMANISSVITEHFRPENGIKCDDIDEKIEELTKIYEHLVEQINILSQDNED